VRGSRGLRSRRREYRGSLVRRVATDAPTSTTPDRVQDRGFSGLEANIRVAMSFSLVR
jgi:hypothetical protein